MEMNVTGIFHGFLIIVMIVIAILIIAAVIRSIIGPKTADRIIAVNMVGTLTISIIGILTIYLEEDYLADVAIVYAAISFLAVVVLTKIYTGIYLERKNNKDEMKAIEDNLSHQKSNNAEEK